MFAHKLEMTKPVGGSKNISISKFCKSKIQDHNFRITFFMFLFWSTSILVFSLSINTYGGTEIPVYRRCVAGMIQRAVRAVWIISIIKK